MRRDAAKKLYDALEKERARLGGKAKLVLMGHSHGMNVILNLAHEAERRKSESFVVDKAIFFGGPVQSETESCISNKNFKKIYHIVSDGDLVQIADCISSKDFISRRLFGTHKKKKIKLPKNLCQVKVVLDKKFHPLHYELWLWGNKSFPHVCYRKRFPLHPVPISAFAPAIVALADEVDATKEKKRLCTLSIDTEKGAFTISCSGQKKSLKADVNRFAREALLAL